MEEPTSWWRQIGDRETDTIALRLSEWRTLSRVEAVWRHSLPAHIHQSVECPFADGWRRVKLGHLRGKVVNGYHFTNIVCHCANIYTGKEAGVLGMMRSGGRFKPSWGWILERGVIRRTPQANKANIDAPPPFSSRAWHKKEQIMRKQYIRVKSSYRISLDSKSKSLKCLSPKFLSMPLSLRSLSTL